MFIEQDGRKLNKDIGHLGGLNWQLCHQGFYHLCVPIPQFKVVISGAPAPKSPLSRGL